MQTKLKRLGSILLSLFMFIGSINLPCNVLPVMAALDSSVKPTSIQSISPVTMAPGETNVITCTLSCNNPGSCLRNLSSKY